MTLIFFGLCMGFLTSLCVASFRARDVFSRNSAVGCSVATAFAFAVIAIMLQNPSAKDIQWLKQAKAEHPQKTREPIVPQPQRTASPTPTIKLASAQAQPAAPPVKIIDAYSAAASPAEPTTPTVPIDYHSKIQSHLLNNQFAEALELYKALARQNAPLSEVTQSRWETQALRQIRPIPASDRKTNLSGYRFLSVLRPNEQSYLSKIALYKD